MIKRTLYFGNPCYLKKKQDQLVVSFPDEGLESKSVPIEDIGIVVLDNPQITITQALLAAISENNAVMINCDAKHLPFALMLPTAGHHVYTEKLRYQLESSVPLRKNLWQQTVSAKIKNQVALLQSHGIATENMLYWAREVKSGDPDNMEARAAAFYWSKYLEGFKRHRYGAPPNNLLNYGYAILRAVVARSLVASGMLPAVGIHHRNKYNPFCLADDVMEPYRPWVDKLVMEVCEENEELEELTPELKRALLSIPVLDILIDNQKSPLMVGIQRTTASLMQCFEGTTRKIVFPEFEIPK
jgi:CRISPR-associated protein Cas1